MVRPDIDLWLQQDVDKDILECRMRVLYDYIKYLGERIDTLCNEAKWRLRHVAG